MNDGKELLYQAIDKKLNELDSISSEDVMFDGINLALLSTSLDESIDNLANVSDEVIDKIMNDTKTLDDELKKTITQLRDLLIGKRDYNLDVKINKTYEKVFKKFKSLFDRLLKKLSPGIKGASEVKENILNIKDAIDRNDLITDFKTVELIVKELDKNKFDTNMLEVMKFINYNNLDKIKEVEEPVKILDINKVKRVKLDDKWEDILTKLDIDYKILPNYLIGEIKRVDASSVRDVFDLIRKNKAEEYGILHLIDKENYIAKIVLMLYSDVDTIRAMTDTFMEDDKLDISLLKVVINNILSAFIVDDNSYFRPKHKEYMKNLEVLKELNINYKVLIKRCPLFMLIKNDILLYTLKCTSEFGCDSKQLINRCYKTIAVYPEIILENIIVLKRYKIDLNKYFKNANDNYNLLKIPKLNLKIDSILKENNLKDASDVENINNLLINRLSKMIIGGAK